MSTETEEHTDRTPDVARKAVYTAPKLTRFGAVSGLTLGSGSRGNDGGGTKAMNTPGMGMGMM